jgi:hypothetical protein
MSGEGLHLFLIRGVATAAACALLMPQPLFAAQVQTVITSGTTYTIPADWNNGANEIETIGPGGLGGKITPGASGAIGSSGGGGGGYAYAINVFYTPFTNVTISVGTAGSQTGCSSVTVFDSPASQGSCYCGSLAPQSVACGAFAQNGNNQTGGVASPAGGTFTAGTKGAGGNGGFNGGAGGPTTASFAGGGGGGGGAGGPNGQGGAGAGGRSASPGGGGGGGGNGGGGSALTATSTNGSPGGNNFSGTGGGKAGTSGVTGGTGTNGGGGGGGFGASGSPTGGGGGSTGTEWTGAGSGGGGGGGGGNSKTTGSGNNPAAGGNAGSYGAGGGGSGGCADNTSGCTTSTAGTGGDGVIIVTYNPATQGPARVSVHGGSITIRGGHVRIYFKGAHSWLAYSQWLLKSWFDLV